MISGGKSATGWRGPGRDRVFRLQGPAKHSPPRPNLPRGGIPPHSGSEGGFHVPRRRRRSRGRSAQSAKIKRFPRQTQVIHNVRDDATRDITWVPRERDQTVRMEGIGVVPVASRSTQQFASQFFEPLFKISARKGWVAAHGLTQPARILRGKEGESGVPPPSRPQDGPWRRLGTGESPRPYHDRARDTRGEERTWRSRCRLHRDGGRSW